MPTIAPSGNGTHPSTKANMRNNSGYVAGNFTAGLVKGLGINTLADDVGKSFGSKVLLNDGTGANTTDRAGVAKAYSPGTLAYNANGTEWLIKGVGVTRKLSGVDNSGIFFAASDWDAKENDNIHATNKSIMVGSGDIAVFDFYANPNGTLQPNFTKPANAGTSFNFVRPSGNGTIAATDEAAAPTRAIPGELTYRFGGALPASGDYKAKDSFEV
jgi:hypothetical protein